MFLIVLLKFVLVLVALFLSRFIPYSGFFPYRERLSWYNVPDFFNRLANFDGIHYLINAEEGYHTYEQAFFPLYPLVIKILKKIFFDNTLITGLIVSNFFFLLSLVLINKFLELQNIKTNTRKWVLIFILFSPFSFFFHTVYTESLFLFLFALTLYTYYQHKRIEYFFSTMLLSSTRLIGSFFLFIPLLSFIKTKKLSHLIYTFLPLTGLIMYATYLYITTGDPLKFYSSQPAFGANRSLSIIFPPQTLFRYLKILFLSKFNYQYVIALTELIVYILFITVIIIQLKKSYRLNNTTRIGIDIFSIINILLPSLTGTLSSIPRYAIMSFSFYYFLAEIKSLKTKIILITICIFLFVLFFSFFLQGYFVA